MRNLPKERRRKKRRKRNLRLSDINSISCV